VCGKIARAGRSHWRCREAKPPGAPRVKLFPAFPSARCIMCNSAVTRRKYYWSTLMLGRTGERNNNAARRRFRSYTILHGDENTHTHTYVRSRFIIIMCTHKLNSTRTTNITTNIIHHRLQYNNNIITF